MTYQPVSGIVPQYSTDDNELASGYYLKFYEANTTTPLSMATDSTGDTLLIKCKLNTAGFPISNPGDDSTVFIPHVNANYRLVIYRDEADADANNTAAALVNIPDVEPLAGNTITTSTGTQTLGDALDGRVVERKTLAELKAIDSTVISGSETMGAQITTTGRAGNFTVYPSSVDFSAEIASDPQEGIYVALTDGGTAVRQYQEPLIINWYGAAADGSTDDSTAIQAALDSGAEKITATGVLAWSGDISLQSTTRQQLYSAKLKNLSTGQIRIKNAGHRVNECFIDVNSQNAIGITIESTATGAKIHNNEIINSGRSAIYSEAIRVSISGNLINGAGDQGSGNFRCAMYLSAPTDNLVTNNVIIDGNWGIYFRTDLANPKSTGVICTGNSVDASAASVTDGQGISFQNQRYANIANNICKNFPDNAIDLQQCDDCDVIGNIAVACKDGVFIGDRSCSGHLIQGNIANGCARGVRFINGAGFGGESFENISIINNIAVSCTDGAVLASVTGAGSSCNNLKISGINVKSLGNGTYGVKLEGSSVFNSSITDCTFNRQPGHNIEIIGCDYVDVSRNIFRDPDFGGGTNNAVNASGTANRIMIRDNFAIGTVSVAYRVDSGSNHTLSGNRWRSIATGVDTTGAAGITTIDNISV